ncbi:MAG: ABC transporter ATP-binding protein, partial [Acidobacteriota bacterium]|nr:ABC transporter ATP-binding protein [Acidobacteriota bacterium]
QRRDCGYVFQNYALFPHMTLRENLAFAAERHPRLERGRRVNEMLDRFRILEHASKLPNEVSGGQKQRCSIARALITQPRLLLLDEPSRGLDSILRNELYQLVGQIRTDYRIPIVLVTHDLDECFALGDTVLVYSGGRILQSGPPRKVYSRPASPEVARTLGITNLFEAEVLALDPGRNTSRLRALGHELVGTYFPTRLLGDRVWLCVPPTELRIQNQPGENRVPVRLERVLERADSVRLEFAPPVSVELSRSEYAEYRENHREEGEWLVEFPPSALRLTG